MKILLLITCLVAISYAADFQMLKKFYDDYANCRNEFNVPEWTPEVIRCMFGKYGLIDEQGTIIPDKLLKSYEITISDEIKLNQAKEISSRCMEQAYEGSGSNEEKVMTIIRCVMPIKDLFDKLQ